MRVIVDFARCDGHGECVEACPEVFAMGDDDDVVVLLDPHPRASLHEKLADAVAVCPKAAIRIER
jgi:ferredoxin